MPDSSPSLLYDTEVPKEVVEAMQALEEARAVRTKVPSYEELENIPTVKPKEDPVVDILLAIRRRVEASWIRGHMKEGTNYCLVGAVQKETVGVVREFLDDSQLPLGPSSKLLRYIVVGPVISYFLAKDIVRYMPLLTDRNYRRAIRALKRQGKFITVLGLINYNDSASRADVLDLIDRAIATRNCA